MHNIPKKLLISKRNNIVYIRPSQSYDSYVFFYEYAYMFVPNEGLIHIYKYNIYYSYTIICAKI